jgi:hypothetical protein
MIEKFESTVPEISEPQNSVMLTGIIKGNILYKDNRVSFNMEVFKGPVNKFNDKDFHIPEYVYPIISTENKELINEIKHYQLKDGDVVLVTGILTTRKGIKMAECPQCHSIQSSMCIYTYIEPVYVHPMPVTKKKKTKEEYSDTTYNKLREYWDISNSVTVLFGRISDNPVQKGENIVSYNVSLPKPCGITGNLDVSKEKQDNIHIETSVKENNLHKNDLVVILGYINVKKSTVKHKCTDCNTDFHIPVSVTEIIGKTDIVEDEEKQLINYKF